MQVFFLKKHNWFKPTTGQDVGITCYAQEEKKSIILRAFLLFLEVLELEFCEICGTSAIYGKKRTEMVNFLQVCDAIPNNNMKYT